MRPSWNDYFMQIAEVVATRSTCDRLRTGTVLVRDKQILSTGYNGSLSGLAHCDDVGHTLVDNHCVATVHAEANAVAQAAHHGINLLGATCYTVGYPCLACFKLLVSSGVNAIYYKAEYNMDPLVKTLAEQLGIVLEKV